jgi:uncharacterized paraquat-inducible protein A
MGHQLKIDFDYDERVVKLAGEFAIMLAPHLAPGTSKDVTQHLAARMAHLANRQLPKTLEPQEKIRCHSCDEMTGPAERVRVVVCPRCSFEGRSPGSKG